MEIPDTAKSRWAFSPYVKPSRSILKTPILTGKSGSQSLHSSPTSPASHVKFGEVQVLEFEQKAGRASHGVPEQGAVSLYMGDLIDRKQQIPVEKFEQERKCKLFQRAQGIQGSHTNVTDDELYTRGRQDLLFGSYTHKDRLRKYQIANDTKMLPEELKQEEQELAKIRKSRKNVGCSCKPISQLTVVELWQVLAKYGLPTHGKRKALQDRVKDEVLQSNSPRLARLHDPSSSPSYSPENTFRFGKPLSQQNKVATRRKKNKPSRKSNLLETCCWDDSCECIQNGIRCHDSSSCGCLENSKPCDNPNGQYIYKQPHYPKKILQEWKREYNDIPSSDNENDIEVNRSCSQVAMGRLSERLCTFVLQ